VILSVTTVMIGLMSGGGEAAPPVSPCRVSLRKGRLMVKAILIALLIGVALVLALWRDLPAKPKPSPVIHGSVV
jgi:hypothetical protein